MWEIEMRVLGFRTKPWGTETMLLGTPQRTPAQGGPAIEISTRLGLGGGNLNTLPGCPRKSVMKMSDLSNASAVLFQHQL